MIYLWFILTFSRMADNPSNSKGIMINAVDEIGQVEIKGIHRCENEEYVQLY